MSQSKMTHFNKTKIRHLDDKKPLQVPQVQKQQQKAHKSHNNIFYYSVQTEGEYEMLTMFTE